MQVIKFKLNDELSCFDEISLCLGYFDGIHLGHQKLIERANKSNYKSAVLTFDFNNDVSLKNKSFLTSLDDKKNILNKMNVDYLFVLFFDDNVKNLSYKDFIHKIILKMNAKELVVGKDYGFGKNAEGNVDVLKRESSLYDVIVIDELSFNSKKIGTSQIISLIKNGDIKTANELLGYYYKITGIVEKGYHLGQKIDFPTANIDLGNYVKPKNGVYLCCVIIDNKKFYGMCNIGKHPTVNKLDSDLLEVHIFNFDNIIYNQLISVEFIDYIREERQFDSVIDLYNQLKKDKKMCENNIKILEKNINKTN